MKLFGNLQAVSDKTVSEINAAKTIHPPENWNGPLPVMFIDKTNMT